MSNSEWTPGLKMQVIINKGHVMSFVLMIFKAKAARLIYLYQCLN